MLAAFSNNANAQKETTKEKTREVIIIKNGDKDQKITIETKDGKVFINGKPASEFKDGDVSVTTGRGGMSHNFSFAPGAKGFQFFNDGDTSAIKKTFLGVTTDGVDNGVKITGVSKESGAEKAGLKEGDVITKIGSKKISDPEDVVNAVTSYKAKDEVTISYLRDGKAREAKAVLGEKTTRNIRSFFNFKNDNGMGGGKMFRDFEFEMPAMPTVPNAQAFRFYSNGGHGRLGVKIEDTENESGARITNVEEESAAAKAGLKKDDIITEVNGKKVNGVNDVRKEVGDVKDKNSYNLKAKRNGTDMNFEIKIPKKINKADL